MAATTIASSARVKYPAAAPSTDTWLARCAFHYSTSIYVVVQDTGGSPKVRVFKSADGSLSFSEQDSANSVSVSDGTYAFSAWLDGTDIHIAAFTASTTVEHFRFSVSSDTWQSDFGVANTDASPDQTIRIGVRSDGDVLIAYCDGTDDADIRTARYEGSSWAETTIESASSSEATPINDAVMDGSDYWNVFHHEISLDDQKWATMSSSNSVIAVDLSGSGALSESNHAPSVNIIYDNAGTDELNFTWFGGGSDPILYSATRPLETTATTSGRGTAYQLATTSGGGADVDHGATHASIKYDGTYYGLYSDNDNAIHWKTSSGTTYGSENTLASSLTNAAAVQLLEVTNGLLAIFQEDTSVKCDWIVSPVTDVSVNGSVATASGQAYGGSVTNGVTGSVATASGVANDGIVAVGATVVGSLATASGAANTGALVAALTGSVASADGQAYAGALENKVTGSLSTATAQGVAGTPKTTIDGSLATASGQAYEGNPQLAILGSLATASAQALDGDQSFGVTVTGSLATATADANDGTVSVVDVLQFENRRYFQIRPRSATEDE